MTRCFRVVDLRVSIFILLSFFSIPRLPTFKRIRRQPYCPSIFALCHIFSWYHFLYQLLNVESLPLSRSHFAMQLTRTPPLSDHADLQVTLDNTPCSGPFLSKTTSMPKPPTSATVLTDIHAHRHHTITSSRFTSRIILVPGQNTPLILHRLLTRFSTVSPSVDFNAIPGFGLRGID